MMDFGEHFGMGILIAQLLQWLKGQKWFPLVNFDTAGLNRLTSVFAALAATGLFHYTWTATGDFSFSGNLWALKDGLKDAAIQYAVQHFVYKAAIAPSAQAPAPAPAPAAQP
jgi:hypothetical protein